MKQLGTEVPGADVTFSAEGANRYGVLVEDGQIVTKASVHVTDAMEPRRQQSREHGDEAGRQQSLKQIRKYD